MVVPKQGFSLHTSTENNFHLGQQAGGQQVIVDWVGVDRNVFEELFKTKLPCLALGRKHGRKNYSIRDCLPVWTAVGRATFLGTTKISKYRNHKSSFGKLRMTLR
jgi:hypothetical protein